MFQKLSSDGRQTLAGTERKHDPYSHFHVPYSGNVCFPKTQIFPFPRYKMVPQVSVSVLVLETRTGTWLDRQEKNWI